MTRKKVFIAAGIILQIAVIVAGGSLFCRLRKSNADITVQRYYQSFAHYTVDDIAKVEFKQIGLFGNDYWELRSLTPHGINLFPIIQKLIRENGSKERIYDKSQDARVKYTFKDGRFLVVWLKRPQFFQIEIPGAGYDQKDLVPFFYGIPVDDESYQQCMQELNKQIEIVHMKMVSLYDKRNR